MTTKEFTESQKGRVYRRGVPLHDNEIAMIHSLENKGFNEKQIMEITKLDIKTVKKYSDHNSTYKVGGNRKYNVKIRDFIKNLVKKDPAIYLKEIQQKMEEDLEVKRSLSFIAYTLEKIGYTRKKAVKICYYRTTERVQTLRQNFKEQIKQYHPHIFYYIDESHFESEDKERNFGRSQKGKEVETHTYKYSNKRYTLIGALSCFGLIYC